MENGSYRNSAFTYEVNPQTETPKVPISEEHFVNSKVIENTSCGFKIKKWFKKYFLDGQKLSEEAAQEITHIPENATLYEKILIKHRKIIGLCIPFCFFQTIWWCLAIKHNFFAYFPDRYLLSITMMFGSTIGGMTSEGGGAVAFPVMTLALGIPSSIARDFSLMIQSCGMTSASFAILFMKITLEWNSIIFCTIGSTFGIILGIEVIDHLMDSDTKKLGFVAIWFSFAFALYLLNREKKRKTYDQIENAQIWQRVLLVLIGFLGGIFSAIAGSGVDICSFSLLTLLFRVSEKVATPTSVILMAANTVIGFFWRALMSDPGIAVESWKYLAVCVPISVVFGPIGSILSSYFHRQVLAFFIYFLDTLALLTALVVIPMTWQLWVLVVCLIVGGFVFFFLLSYVGQRLMAKDLKRKKEEEEERTRV